MLLTSLCWRLFQVFISFQLSLKNRCLAILLFNILILPSLVIKPFIWEAPGDIYLTIFIKFYRRKKYVSFPFKEKTITEDIFSSNFFERSANLADITLAFFL